jgi:glycine cleavage system regulatory protein
MHGFAIEPDSACPAIARIAAFFDTKPAEIANESSQTLSRTRFSAERLSIDLVIHYRFSGSGGKFLANLFGEVIGELFAMRW